MGCLSRGSEGRDGLCELSREGRLRKKEWKAQRSETVGRFRVRVRVRGWEVVREAEHQLVIRQPPRAFYVQPSAEPRGPESQPCSPPLKPQARDSCFAGPLIPTGGIKEDFQRVTSKLNCICQGRLRGEAEM